MSTRADAAAPAETVRVEDSLVAAQSQTSANDGRSSRKASAEDSPSAKTPADESVSSSAEKSGFFRRHWERLKQKFKTLDPMWYWVAAFLLCVLIFNIYWTTLIPIGKAPDEAVRLPINDYIAQHGTLPNGWDESVRIHNWGFSYALRPILVSAISALFMKIASLFSGSLLVQLLAVRLVSAIFGTVLVYYMFRIARALQWRWPWAWGMGIFTALIPQVTFLASYHNNDIFSMACTAAVTFAWIRGIRSKWDWNSCIRLAVTLALTLLSYYNAYGYVLFSIPLFFITIFHKGMSREEKILAWKKTGAIILITFILAGWWFIRNIILYNGDVFGSQTREIMGEMYAYDGLKPSQVRRLSREGVPLLATINSDLLHDPWWLITFRSSYASVGYVELYLDSLDFYRVMAWFMGVGWVAAAVRWFSALAVSWKDKFRDEKVKTDLIVIFFSVASAAVVFILSVYYSWSDDYQPQGRYVLPALCSYMLVMFYGAQLICSWIEKMASTRKVKDRIVMGFCASLILLNVISQGRMLYLINEKFDEPLVNDEFINHRIEYGPAFETDGYGHSYDELARKYEELKNRKNEKNESTDQTTEQSSEQNMDQNTDPGLEQRTDSGIQQSTDQAADSYVDDSYGYSETYDENNAYFEEPVPDWQEIPAGQY